MQNMFKIYGNHEEFPEFKEFQTLAGELLPFAQKRLGFNKPIGVNLVSDPINAKDPLGKTAYYDPNKMQITIIVDKRHVKDILRSMAHELVHHTQNCRGEFENGIDTSPGYAQVDGHMREMESEAYLEGQLLLRDWEDGNKQIKENKTMKMSKEKLKQIIKEMIEEEMMSEDPSLEEAEELEETVPDTKDFDKLAKGLGKTRDQGLKKADDLKKAKKAGKARKKKEFADEAGKVAKRAAKVVKKATQKENWHKGNKDKQLFERLMEKWTK